MGAFQYLILEILCPVSSLEVLVKSTKHVVGLISDMLTAILQDVVCLHDEEDMH